MDPKAVVASLIAGTDLIRPTASVLRLVKQHEQFFNVTSGDPKETDLVHRRRLYRHDPGRFAQLDGHKNSARDDATRLTNVFTGRPARGLINRFVAEVGPMCEDAPQFPLAAEAAAPLRTAAEQRGSGDFSPLWAGESAALARDEGSVRQVQQKAVVD